MTKIELTYVKGEEYYTCTNCGKRIPSEIIEDYLYGDEEMHCINCGEVVEDMEF